MKKVLLSLCALLAINYNANAQITLVASGYTTSPIGVDTLMVTAAASTFPSFAPATNATWDLTTITDSPAILLDYHVGASAPATYADSSVFSFGGYAYQGNVQRAIISAAMVEYGIKINGSTNPLGTVGDTLFIPSQSDTYPTMRTVIQFPATMTSTWTSSYVDTLDFFLSYVSAPLPPLVHSPGMLKEYVTEKDTVIGWGKMRIKNISGTPSGYQDVLQMRSMKTTTDSFYLNGSATNPLLTALLPLLGTSQGHVTKSYSQFFGRIDNIIPLAVVKFSDSANTTPTKVTTNVQRLSPSAVATIPGKASINVYPNPVTGNVINVTLPMLTGTWSYELTDIAGRKVQDGLLPSAGNDAQVTLLPALINGIYHLKVNCNGSTVSVMPIEVAK